MDSSLPVILTFVIVLAGVFGAYFIVVARPEMQEQSALRRRLKAEEAAAARLNLLREDEPLSSIGPLDALLHRFTGVSDPIKKLIEESGLTLTVGRFILLTAGSFVLVGAIAQQYIGIWWVALIAGVIGGTVPLTVVRVARTNRLRKFEEQFPEAVELIARALRAGHAFATGLKMTAEEIPAPAGPEFKLLFDRQNYGASLGDALRAFGQRIPLLDARFFVTAVLTQRETGGNLSEVLDRLAAVMRERFRIRREVRVKSAHGRMTAYVLAGLPPVLGITLALLNPQMMRLLIDDPIGNRMLATGAGLQILGTLIVRKLVDIRY